MNGPDGVTFANCGPLAADDNCRHHRRASIPGVRLPDNLAPRLNTRGTAESGKGDSNGQQAG